MLLLSLSYSRKADETNVLTNVKCKVLQKRWGLTIKYTINIMMPITTKMIEDVMQGSEREAENWNKECQSFNQHRFRVLIVYFFIMTMKILINTKKLPDTVIDNSLNKN